MSAHRVAQSVPVSPPTLLELAERCEQAAGADRKLDAEIDIAVRGFPQRAYEQANGMRGRGSPDLDPIEWFIKWGAARYTASLDAAMTLWPGEVPHLIPSDPRICSATALRAQAPSQTPWE